MVLIIIFLFVKNNPLILASDNGNKYDDRDMFDFLLKSAADVNAYAQNIQN